MSILSPRSIPAASLVEVAMSLRSFCAMVGRAAFGSEWHDDDIAKVNLRLDQRPSDDPSLRQWFVAEQVLLALQTNVIRAGLRLSQEDQILKAASRQTPPAEKHITARYFEDLNDLSDAIEDLDPLDDPTIQIVDPQFWNDQTNMTTVNIFLSRFEISPRYIYYLSSERKYHPLYVQKGDEAGPSKIVASVFVINAYRALRNMNHHWIPPEPEWFDRYMHYRNRVLDEVVAAAWRFIVIKNLQKTRGINTKIIEAMQEYLKSQGLGGSKGLSDKVLEVLAGKIVRQWNEDGLSASILLSSSPSRSEDRKK